MTNTLSHVFELSVLGPTFWFLDSSSDGGQVASTTGDFAPSGNLGLQASWRTDEAGRGRPEAALLTPMPVPHQPSDERPPHAVSSSGSIIQRTAPRGTNWVLLDPPDVPGDNTTGSWYGVPPPVTWNLQ